MIRCREVVERLWTYLDGDLEEADRLAIEEHLRLCVRCCGETAFAKEIRNTLATRSRPKMPDDVQRLLEQFIEGLDAPKPNT
ncbi:zf-HC2 domain-containing protein [Glycomyces sp. L485]|uniref:zf-HC2 domain-containing protein n=1 Tax=Glycomyces sp. L485 TaxID=2909235 RepID=UPI001F4AF4E5|nr:zf-HC2 domain-containing protein [Glycomyces sp. L485]MCH7231649.1 zf-HC2 domain-containing protein [Glycomyces sp. L485]